MTIFNLVQAQAGKAARSEAEKLLGQLKGVQTDLSTTQSRLDQEQTAGNNPPPPPPPGLMRPFHTTGCVHQHCLPDLCTIHSIQVERVGLSGCASAQESCPETGCNDLQAVGNYLLVLYLCIPPPPPPALCLIKFVLTGIDDLRTTPHLQAAPPGPCTQATERG